MVRVVLKEVISLLFILLVEKISVAGVLQAMI